MQKGKIRMKMKQLLFGHLLNPLWHDRIERRKRRGEVVSSSVGRYLDKYADVFAGLDFPPAGGGAEPERIFSIWLQGESAAPGIVLSCIESIRRNSGMEVEILDMEGVMSRTALPAFILERFKAGRLRPAHFADICRLDLLYRHGGVWMDATDFLPAPIPAYIMDEPFFVYMAEGNLAGSYAFVQNCFIRAEKGNPIVGAWLAAVVEYWKNEDVAADYFIHQLILKKLVECNARVAELFEAMPHMNQGPTHVLWFEKGKEPYDGAEFKNIVSAAAFQKTEYKSALAKNPPSGSFAEALLNYRADTGTGNCR